MTPYLLALHFTTFDTSAGVSALSCSVLSSLFVFTYSLVLRDHLHIYLHFTTASVMCCVAAVKKSPRT